MNDTIICLSKKINKIEVNTKCLKAKNYIPASVKPTISSGWKFV